MQDPGLVVDGLDRVGLRLEDEVVLLDGTAEERPGLVRLLGLLGDREEQVAVVEVDRGGVELGHGLLGPGQGKVELLGLVVADGDGQQERAFLIARANLVGDRLGVGEFLGRGLATALARLGDPLDEQRQPGAVVGDDFQAGLQGGNRLVTPALLQLQLGLLVEGIGEPGLLLDAPW